MRSRVLSRDVLLLVAVRSRSFSCCRARGWGAELGFVCSCVDVVRCLAGCGWSVGLSRACVCFCGARAVFLTRCWNSVVVQCCGAAEFVERWVGSASCVLRLCVCASCVSDLARRAFCCASCDRPGACAVRARRPRSVIVPAGSVAWGVCVVVRELLAPGLLRSARR